MSTWLPIDWIPGFEGRYEVSCQGEVRSLGRKVWVRPTDRKAGYWLPIAGGVMRPGLASNGYLTVCLSADALQVTHTVHSLVARAFLGPRPLGEEVRHGPLGRHDNRAESLCYGTPAQNQQEDRIRDGTRPVGERNPRALLKEVDVARIRSLPHRGEAAARTAGAHHGVSHHTIIDIWRGRSWRHLINKKDPVPLAAS